MAVNAGHPPGVLLAQAADMAIGAYRLSVAALIRLEDAEAGFKPQDLLGATDLVPVDVPNMIESLDAFCKNTLRLADTFGHAEVGRRFFSADGP